MQATLSADALGHGRPARLEKAVARHGVCFQSGAATPVDFSPAQVAHPDAGGTAPAAAPNTRYCSFAIISATCVNLLCPGPLASRCPGRRLSTWPTTGVSCPTALDALCAQLTFRLACCRQHSAVMATELLQPRDLACGTLFQFSCVIPTSPTDCSDDS